MALEREAQARSDFVTGKTIVKAVAATCARKRLSAEAEHLAVGDMGVAVADIEL